MKNLILLLCLFVCACKANILNSDYSPTGGIITSKQIDTNNHLTVNVRWCDTSGQCFISLEAVDKKTYDSLQVDNHFGEEHPRVLLNESGRVKQSQAHSCTIVICVGTGFVLIFFLAGVGSVLHEERPDLFQRKPKKSKLPKVKIVETK